MHRFDPALQLEAIRQRARRAQLEKLGPTGRGAFPPPIIYEMGKSLSSRSLTVQKYASVNQNRGLQHIVRTRDRQVQQIAEANAKANDQGWIVANGRKRPLYDVLPDGSWRGHRAFIIAGGPSLRGFDFDRLRGEKIIAVNRAFEFVPFADILYSMDNRLYRWFANGTLGEKTKLAFMAFRGIKVWLDLMNFPYHGIFYVRGLREDKPGQGIRAGIYHGNNSGFGALKLAAALKANPIYLLGYDMKHHGGITHFYPAYPIRQSTAVVERFRPYFNKAAPGLVKQGIKVVNLNPNSALRCFPFDTIENVLKEDGHGDDHDIRVETTEAEPAHDEAGTVHLADGGGGQLPEMSLPDVH